MRGILAFPVRPLLAPCPRIEQAGETIHSLDFWFFSSRKRTREIGAQAIPKQHQKRKKKHKQRKVQGEFEPFSP
jgi:hypothetical protein